jgi:hypothetical protein
MSIPAKQGEAVTLAMVLSDGATGLYPQAEIYDGASLETTIDLADLGQGRYEGSWVPGAVGAFTALFNVYNDATHTVQLTPLIYSREIEQVFVTLSSTDDLAANIARILGLVHENAFIDNTIYDANAMLLSGRIRIFDSKANVQAATKGGIGEAGTVAEYTIEADYAGPGKMDTYRMVKE